MIKILETASYSFPKTEARINQDSILTPKPLESGFLLAIADGVGSYKGGELASNQVINHLSQITDKSLVTTQIDDLFFEVRNKVINLNQKSDDYNSAATTLTVCYIDEHNLYVGHVGDCRLYIKNNNNKLIQLTKDHTQFQELVDAKIYTRKFLKDKKVKNILTTAIANNVEMNVDFLKFPISEVSDNNKITIYLMSDGSHKYWDLRPRFSVGTLNNVNRFASSLKRRIEVLTPSDDYSLVAVTFSVTN